MVLIIIPIHNLSELTDRCLQSIESCGDETPFRIALVDNGSTPPYEVKTNLPLTLVRSEINLGFSVGCNQGVQLRYPGEAILFLNNDTVVHPGWLDTLVEFGNNHPEVGVVGSLLLFPDGRIQHAGAFLNDYGWGQHLYAGHEVDTVPISSREVEYVCGACLYVKSEVVDKLGGFDEQFNPAFFEEVDYCYRAREIGYKTFVCVDSIVTHLETATAKQLWGKTATSKVSHANQIKFFRKWAPVWSQETENDPETPKVFLNGKVYGTHSFCIVIKHLAKGLANNGVDVSIAPEDYYSRGPIEDWQIKQCLLKPKDYWNRIGIRYSEGDFQYNLAPAKYRIAYTVEEASELNPYWVQQLNRTDEIWTPSNFCKDVLIGSGVKSHIEVIPNCFDPTIFNLTKLKLHLKSSPSDSELVTKFNFLTVFNGFGERKGTEVLIRAFLKAFKKSDDVSLTLHCPGLGGYFTSIGLPPQEYLNRLGDTGDRGEIFLSDKYLPPEAMGRYYQNFDCFVLPTRGEGFGLPLIEIAACSIPSIVTGWSGHTDFLNEENAYLIQYNLVDIPLQILPYWTNYTYGQWAEPIEEHLIALLRHAVAHPEEVKEKGKKAAEMSKAFTIDAIGKLASSRVKQIWAGL